ncbi:MAG: GntR family transcriptional regulator [Candidatus Izimaplasma sp.]|nr:GntR family transcriptional regulator [Candidatus Izimaplasma bacterium]
MRPNQPVPKYIHIAYLIAQKIKKGKVKENERLRGRSLASSEFNVSSETVRRAFSILQDNGIVEIKKNSGTYVLSRAKAIRFLKIYNEQENSRNTFKKIYEIIGNQKKQAKKLQKEIKKLNDQQRKLFDDSPIEVFEIKVPEKSQVINHSVKEVDFYTNTGATLYGIQSETKIISSPDYNIKIQKGDILFFSGNNTVFKKTLTFINPKT